MLERILDRLRRDKLSAGSLEQVFLPVGDVQKSIFINSSDITGFEPAVHERLASFLRLVPIGMKNRWPSHQNLTIIRDSHLQILQRLSHTADPVRHRSISGDHRRRFRQSIAFMNSNPNVREPLRQMSAQRCSARNEEDYAAADPSPNFGIHDTVCELPCKRPRCFAGQNILSMRPAYAQCPAVNRFFGKLRRLQICLCMNFLVHSRNTQQNVRTNFTERLRKPLQLRQMRQRDSAIKHAQVNRSRGHVRKWQKRYATHSPLESEIAQKK